MILPLLGRLTAPLRAEPETVYAIATARQLLRACSLIGRRCETVLAAPVSGSGGSASGPADGVQRRARLCARAALPLAGEVACELSDALPG